MKDYVVVPLSVMLAVACVVGAFFLGIYIGERNHEYEVTLDNTGCTYVEVAQPDLDAGLTWTIGWKKECKNDDGDWIAEPLVEFGRYESAEEALLRWEKMLGVSGFTGGPDVD